MRFSIELTGLTLCDEAGNDADIAVPVTDEFGIPCFAPARFRGHVLRDGQITDFTAGVRPPEPAANGCWGCKIESSDFDLFGPILSSWPEHAYEMAFRFIRQMLAYRGEGSPVDSNGAPLLIRAPVRSPRSR